jgi:hypothetical protein
VSVEVVNCTVRVSAPKLMALMVALMARDCIACLLYFRFKTNSFPSRVTDAR